MIRVDRDTLARVRGASPLHVADSEGFLFEDVLILNRSIPFHLFRSRHVVAVFIRQRNLGERMSS